jgi:DNA-binding NarL/FixJ family response regulator
MIPRIKIILADDHRIFRDGLKSLLTDADFIDVIGEASGGQELLDLLTTLTPDIVIVDITMPGLSGIEVANRISCRYPDIRILVLSMHTHEEFVINAIKAGAKGYLSKDTSRDELLDAIRILYHGGECFGKLVSETFMKSYVRKVRSESVLLENKILTHRELELLKLVATGLSNQEIAERLFISPKTVDCHKGNIMQKLKLKNTAEMVLYAVKNKLIEV